MGCATVDDLFYERDILEGTPEDAMKVKKSYTGQFLKTHFARHGK